MKFTAQTKCSRKEQKERAKRSRNGTWTAFRPVTMRDKTRYTRKGRRVLNA